MTIMDKNIQIAPSAKQSIQEALSLLHYPSNRTVWEMRKLIVGLEAAMQAMPEYVLGKDFQTTHRFDPGVYIRECVIPAGFTVTGKIHKYGHWNFLMKGAITVWTEEGMKTLTAPAVISSRPGIKRVGYAHQETIWITVHANPSDERDIKKVEERLFADTFEQAYLTSSRTFEDAILFLGFSAEEVKALSENPLDQIPFPVDQNEIRVGDSPIHGIGIFAEKNINQGSVIAPARINGKRTPVGRFCNHSGDPNGRMEMSVNGDVYLIAAKKIDAGSEICNDYYLTFENSRFPNKEIEICHQS